ncbi:MAG: hypothetical protein ACOYIP_04445 [Coriobacteriales bacterium]
MRPLVSCGAFQETTTVGVILAELLFFMTVFVPGFKATFTEDGAPSAGADSIVANRASSAPVVNALPSAAYEADAKAHMRKAANTMLVMVGMMDLDLISFS